MFVYIYIYIYIYIASLDIPIYVGTLGPQKIGSGLNVGLGLGRDPDRRKFACNIVEVINLACETFTYKSITSNVSHSN